MKFRKYLEGLEKVSEVGRFVIGNTSVDYDSFFGSIILAYFLTTTTGSMHLPLIDCLQRELPLRFEIM
jgi:inorganic pyrophosphatase/exopolyphosphatase